MQEGLKVKWKRGDRAGEVSAWSPLRDICGHALLTDIPVLFAVQGLEMRVLMS